MIQQDTFCLVKNMALKTALCHCCDSLFFSDGYKIYSWYENNLCLYQVSIKTQIIQGKNFHCFNTEVGQVTSFSLQIKLSSVQLARKYMKRVASELDTMSGPEKEPNREFLVLQGVRFAFRVHQVYFISMMLNLNTQVQIIKMVIRRTLYGTARVVANSLWCLYFHRI